MKKNILLALSAVIMSLGAVGCGGGGGGTVTVSTGPITHAWYDVYKTQCLTVTQALPGCDFYAPDGVSKISYGQDPYFAPLNYGTYAFTDVYGGSQYYTGWARLTADGILFNDLGQALNSEDANEGHDMIADVAARAQQTIKSVGKEFADKYALSDDKGIEIATTLNDWATLGKLKGRTEADQADFTKRLFGVTVDQVKPALEKAKTGDLAALSSLNGDVAAHWGTDAETSKTIMASWFKHQIADYQASAK